MITLPKLCNPYFCDGQHERMLSPERLEGTLLRYMKHRIAIHIIIVLFTFQSDFQSDFNSVIRSFSQRLLNPNIFAEKNSLGLKSFRAQLQLFLSREMNLEGTRTLMSHFYVSMAGAGIIKEVVPCLHALSEGIITNSLGQDYGTPIVVDQLSLATRNLRKKAWTEQENISFFELVSVEIVSFANEVTVTSLITKWLNYLLISSSSTRLAQYACVLREVTVLNQSDRKYPNPFSMSLESWCENELEGKDQVVLGIAELEKIKECADQHVALKKYESAIQYYDCINSMSWGSPSLRLQSLTNCAAVRLRLKNQPEHLPLVIFECTMALEIDPNHVKALFRRGLGLALCKKWNEAIVDFERALELDPDSPAKKELEVARRQVTRRIGN